MNHKGRFGGDYDLDEQLAAAVADFLEHFWLLFMIGH